MVKISIDRSKCDLCGLCVRLCPSYVFYIKEGKLVADTSRCVECYGCIPLCPRKAISIDIEDP